MSSIADYVGRTYDLVALHGVRSSGDVLLSQTLVEPGNPGEICTGIQKLAQWFVVELLTEEGTVPLDATRGTQLLSLLRQGRLRNDVDVRIAFNFAVGRIQGIANQLESDTMPADERFKDAVLLSLTLQPDSASFLIQVISRAESTFAFILPISTLPTRIS